MPSPVGHSLLGLAAGQLTGHRLPVVSWTWLAFVIVVANCPDLDFVPGIIAGDMNRYHHRVTHSVGAAFTFGLAVWVIARWRSDHAGKWAQSAVIIYGSHLLGDYLAVDYTAPYGIPLWWPLSDAYVISPVTLFAPIDHGALGEENTHVLTQIFSLQNAISIAQEILFLMPLVLIIWHCDRRFAQWYARR